MAALLPHSSLVAVPGTGHSVYGSDLTGCSILALDKFFANKPVRTTCRKRGGRLRPDGPIPHSLRDLHPAAARGKAGRTVTAAARTVFDVLEQAADSLLTDPLGIIRGGGLRGGWYHETTNAIVLHNVTYVEGVRVSGLLTEGGNARLVVSGPSAARGRLRLVRYRVIGVLGAHPVSGRIRSLSNPALAAVSRHLSR